MKKFFLRAGRLCLSVLISLALLSAFCLVFNYTGCHISNPSGSTDYKWESRQFFSTMKEGLSWFRFDKNGFNNTDDTPFDEKPVDILLMGSSHMEGVNLPKDKNVGHLLNEYLPGMRTYNIGVSSHGIYTNVRNMKTACAEFSPRAYVVLEANFVTLNAEKMKQVISGDYPDIESHDSGLMYRIQKTVPAVKSLYKSLTEWKDVSSFSGAGSDNAEKTSAASAPDYAKTLNSFLALAASQVPEGRKLIIFFHPETYINGHGGFETRTDENDLALFDKCCRENGIIFIDETEASKELYLEKNILAHGFVNTAVGYGHLNEEGHRVIAQSVAGAIKKDTEVKVYDAE